MTQQPNPTTRRHDPTGKNRQLRRATRADRKFMVHLARRFSTAVGYLSTAAIEKYLDLGAVLIGTENGVPAGYVLATHQIADLPRHAQIYQAAVELDARRHSVGRDLVAATVQAAADRHNFAVQLWCASDLEANEFWTACGGQPVALRPGGKQRKRLHILWRLQAMPAATVWTPAATRRRSESGLPIMLPEDITAAAVISAAKEDRCAKLFASLQKAASSGCASPSTSQSSSPPGLFPAR